MPPLGAIRKGPGATVGAMGKGANGLEPPPA